MYRITAPICRSQKRKGEKEREAHKHTHLEALDQRRLLPTDVRSSPSVQVDVEVVPGTTRVLAQEPFLQANKNDDEGGERYAR